MEISNQNKEIFEFIKDLVNDLLNPAYVTDDNGCIIARNKRFKNLTKFTNSDIEKGNNVLCYNLFDGYVEQPEGKYIKYCSNNCKFRKQADATPHILKDFWIKSKDIKDGNII